MALLVTGGKTIFFVHVPKCGGSSVEDYLVRRFGGVFMLDRHKRNRVRGTGLISPVTHLSALDLEEIVPPGGDLVFAFVRDPLKRAQSAYRWQMGHSRTSRMSFSTWLRIVLAAAGLEPRVYENHIRPMDQMVPEGAEVFRLEDGFGGMIARLDAVTGTTAPDIDMGHFKRTESAPITVSRQDAALIADFYAADYARFGYAPPDPGAFPPDPRAGWRGVMAAPLARMLVARQKRNWVR